MVITRLHIFSMMALTIMGVVILALSLIAANSLSSSGGHSFSGGLKLYYTKEILPDHMLYPVLRLRDRIALESAMPQEQINLRIRYAEHRYEVSQKLLDKEDDSLALSTLSKSQKYLLTAAQQAVAEADTSPEKLQQIREALDHSLYRLSRFSEQYEGSSGSIIEQLHDETEAMIEKLDDQISK